MCRHCWEECGSPRVDTPRVRNAARLCAEVFEQGDHPRVHSVLSEWNLGNVSLSWALDEVQSAPDSSARDVELECLFKLQALSLEGRASALALAEGWWS